MFHQPVSGTDREVAYFLFSFTTIEIYPDSFKLDFGAALMMFKFKYIKIQTNSPRIKTTIAVKAKALVNLFALIYLSLLIVLRKEKKKTQK